MWKTKGEKWVASFAGAALLTGSKKNLYFTVAVPPNGSGVLTVNRIYGIGVRSLTGTVITLNDIKTSSNVSVTVYGNNARIFVQQIQGLDTLINNTPCGLNCYVEFTLI